MSSDQQQLTRLVNELHKTRLLLVTLCSVICVVYYLLTSLDLRLNELIKEKDINRLPLVMMQSLSGPIRSQYSDLCDLQVL